MPPKVQTQPTKPKLTSILIRLTTDQHDQLKNATNKLAGEVGLQASVSAFVLKAATDRARQILADTPE